MVLRQILLYKFLDQITSTINISKSELKEIKKRIEVKKIPKKTLLLKSGEYNLGFYIILLGLVRQFKTVDNKEYNLDFAISGEIVGNLLSTVDGVPSPLNIETLEKSYVIYLSLENLNWFEENVKEGKKMVRMAYAENLSLIVKQYISILNPNPLNRFEELYTRIPDIEQRVSQKMIATYLNITPGYLSTLKSKTK